MKLSFPACLSAALLGGVLLATQSGCSQKPESAKEAATINSSFASAAPELKQHWDSAHALAEKKDLNGAVPHLLALADNASKLTPEQVTALRQFWSDFGTQAFQAASAGDKAGMDALNQMKANKFGNPEGR